jgi:arginine/lysine/ornithine decarboxylase
VDHSRAPVLDALAALRRRGDRTFEPPGHRQGAGVDPRVLDVLGTGTFAADESGLNAVDDRRKSRGTVGEAEALLADAVGADRAFFMTAGSSTSIKSAVLAVAAPGEQLVVARNSHKSVMAALVLGGIHPVWMRPRRDAERHLAHPPGAAEAARALDEHPDARGVLLVTPTDYGACADVAEVARECHARDRPLIVDEAWGAHLPFHPELPPCGMQDGADVAVISVHKMGGGLGQASAIHLQGDRVDPSVMAQRTDLLDTTSPSSLVHASIDGWRRQMVEQGVELLGAVLDLGREVRALVDATPGLHVLDRELVGPDLAAAFDPFTVVVDVGELGINGFQAMEWLASERRVRVALGDHRHVAVKLAVGDDADGVAHLVAALRDLTTAAGRLPRLPGVQQPSPGEFDLELAQLPRDALFGPAEQVPARRAVGRVAAEMISPYPPGVPVCLPGEVLTAAVVEHLTSGIAAGMFVPDAVDPTLETVRVVA